MSKKHWIKQAVKKVGALSEAAKREGVSNASYEEEHKHDSGKAGQRSRFALNVKHLPNGSGKPRKAVMEKRYGKE